MKKNTQQALSLRGQKKRDGVGQKKTAAQTACFADSLFPDHIQLLLDFSTRTAVLLRSDEGGAVSLLHSQQLTPSGFNVFLALLQAYPRPCLFTTLFACLALPQPKVTPEVLPFNGRDPDWVIAVRPLRRVVSTLTPMVSAFGLQVISLRNKGYLLALDIHAWPSSLANGGPLQSEGEKPPSAAPGPSPPG